jgi:superfamily II DNA or RNA helicase
LEWDASECGSDSLRSNGVRGTGSGLGNAALPFAGFLDSLPPACDALRPYQRQGIAQIAEALRDGERRILRQLPTGGGKTHEIAAVTACAVNAGLRVLILATRTRLVRQIHERLEAFGVPHGIIAADLRGMFDAFQFVQVASADTLHRRCIGDARMPLPAAEVVIFDEGHLAAADSRMAILEQYPQALRLGFTATPARKSGKSLSMVFDRLILGPSILELIRAGSLVRPRIFNVPVVSPEELKALPKDAAGDYAEGAVGTLLSRPKLIGDVIENWLAIASGKRSIVFACNKAHGASLVEGFGRAGIAAELLIDQDDEATREQAITRLESGQTRVLVNCFLMAYGVDVPAVECIVLARPTRSLPMYLQMVGRGMRPAPDKDHFVLIDHGRVVENLGLPTSDFGWNLDDTRNVNREAEKRTRSRTVEQPRTCPECRNMWLVSADGSACKLCGWAPAPSAKAVAVQSAALAELDVDGEARTVTAHSPEAEQFFREALGDAARRDPAKWANTPNKCRAAAWHAMGEKFGLPEQKIPSGYWSMQPATPSAQVAGWLTHRRIKYARARSRVT